MYYLCCVCKRSRKDAVLHRFPSGRKRRNVWLNYINRDDLKKLLPKQVANLFVCHKHFDKRFITCKSRLSAKAYPSLLTEDEISSGIPSQGNTSTTTKDSQLEHSYSLKCHNDHTYCQEDGIEDTAATGSVCSDVEDASWPSEIALSIQDQQNDTIHMGSVDVQNVSWLSQIALSIQDHQNDTINTDDHNVSRPTQITFSIQDHQNDTSAADSVCSDGQNVSRPLQIAYHQNGSDNTKRINETNLSNIRNRGQRNLCEKYKMMLNEVRKAKKLKYFYQKAKKALKFNKKKYLEKITENMNPIAKTIINMQINLCQRKKSKKGLRFTTEEKLLALCIMKQNPQCYRFLKNIFIFPSKTTLNKMISSSEIQTDISSQALIGINGEVAQLTDMAD